MQIYKFIWDWRNVRRNELSTDWFSFCLYLLEQI